jgi:hypothetical protein
MFSFWICFLRSQPFRTSRLFLTRGEIDTRFARTTKFPFTKLIYFMQAGWDGQRRRRMAQGVGRRPAFSPASPCEWSTSALRDVTSLAALIVPKQVLIERSNRLSDVIAYIETERYTHETRDNRAVNCIRSSKYIRACGRPNEPGKSCRRPFRGVIIVTARPHDNQAQEPFRKCVRSLHA